MTLLYMTSRKIQTNFGALPHSEAVNNHTQSQPVATDRGFFGDALPMVIKIWKILCRLMEELADQSLDDGNIEHADLICRNTREYLAVKSIRDINQAQDKQFTASVFKSLKKEKRKRGIF